MPDVARWDPVGYQQHAGFVPRLGLPVVDLLQPRAGERILDLGCGDGVLSLELIARGATVVGIDASPEMVVAAQGRGIDALVVDGEALPFDSEFDAVFSNAALHWMTKPDLVLAGVRRALKPGGRFVGEMGGHGNVATVTVAMSALLSRRGRDSSRCNPWFFPTATAYGLRLRDAGFRVDTIELIPRPTALTGDPREWLGIIAGPWLNGVDEAERTEILDEAFRLIRTALSDEHGDWTADYNRLRFAAHLPGSS